MSHTDTINIGATVWNTDDTANTRRIIGDRWEAYSLEANEVLVESYSGHITIGVMTGKTRNFFRGVHCPTMIRYEVETYATEDGVIMGRKGDRISGTSAVRPEQVNS